MKPLAPDHVLLYGRPIDDLNKTHLLHGLHTRDGKVGHGFPEVPEEAFAMLNASATSVTKIGHGRYRRKKSRSV